MIEIPAEVLAVLKAQAAALAKVLPKHRARLLAISLDVQRELEAQLKALAPGRFTTQETRVKLMQVRAVVDLLGAELGQRVGRELEDIGKVAARIGRDGLIDQIGAWADKFPGAVRRISPAEVAGDLLDEGLLEYYRVSRETYGMEAISKMRGELARGIMAGQTLTQTVEALSAAVDISDVRAERIVRTEGSFAAHRRQIEDAKALDLGLAKQLVTTFDDRTGEDSKFVDGQTRELDEPFTDNEGRVYQHPPNRPNDRETVVFVPNTLNELGPPAVDATGEASAVPAGLSGSPIAALTVPSLPPDPTAVPEGPETVWDPSDLAAEVPIKRENEAGIILRRAGYSLKRNQGKNAAGKSPDYQIDGVDFDCYAPTTASPRNVWATIRGKVDDKQAKRFVINLKDFDGSTEDLKRQFAEWPMDDLEQVLIIDKDGAISQLFP